MLDTSNSFRVDVACCFHVFDCASDYFLNERGIEKGVANPHFVLHLMRH